MHGGYAIKKLDRVVLLIVRVCFRTDNITGRSVDEDLEQSIMQVKAGGIFWRTSSLLGQVTRKPYI